MKRNFLKRETSLDYTSWDLNCRKYVRHTKARNRLEKIFKRHNRRKIRKMLDKYIN